MGAIGDALALVLLELQGFTRYDYGLRHHGGYLGPKSRGEAISNTGCVRSE
jgi:arabinose-5-phosphate isomerase